MIRDIPQKPMYVKRETISPSQVTHTSQKRPMNMKKRTLYMIRDLQKKPVNVKRETISLSQVQPLPEEMRTEIVSNRSLLYRSLYKRPTKETNKRELEKMGTDSMKQESHNK